jgi:hypothetical protein
MTSTEPSGIESSNSADKTAALNHLFVQGRVAIETLRHDREAGTKFLDKLDHLAPGHPLDLALSSLTVVYAIMLKDGVPLTRESLFAFRQGVLAARGHSAAGRGRPCGDRPHLANPQRGRGRVDHGRL